VGRPYRHDPQEVRKAAFALRAAHAEYLTQRGSFIYYAYQEPSHTILYTVPI
jgi:hypothetical protein